MSEGAQSELPDWLRAIYPFRSHYLEQPKGVRQHYVDEGRGPAVLMVHGNPSWSFLYRRLVTGLHGQYRCLVPDHVGCGLSDKPQDYPYRLEQHIDNLSRVLEHSGEDGFDLIVHDWGGAIGMGVATRFAERVRRLVVLNTAAFPSPHMPLRIALCRWPLLGGLIVRGFNGFAWPATWMAVSKPLSQQVKDGFLYPYGSWADRVAIHRFVQDIPMSPSHPSHDRLLQVEAGLEKLREKPMLVLWGGRDFCFNDHFLDGWKQRFPQAEVHRYADAGHYVLEDEPESSLERIRTFLG